MQENQSRQKSQFQNQQQQEHSQQFQIIQFDQDFKKEVHQLEKDFIYQKNEMHITYRNSMNSKMLIYILRKSNINCKPFDLSAITKLFLIYNKIGDDGIKQLCRKQYQLRGLKDISLNGNLITMKGVQYLSKAAEMKLFPQLQLLWLKHNQINSNGSQHTLYKRQKFIQNGLLLKFADNNTKLKQLSLQDNNLNDNDMLKLFKFQFSGDEKDKTKGKIFNRLEILSLENNKITKCQIKTSDNRKLSEQYPLLRVLYLHENKINKYGIKNLINDSISNPNGKSQSRLSSLTLSNNELCGQAIKILSSNKSAFNNLTFLGLSQNPLIGDQGIHYLLKACQEGVFPKLKTLYLRLSNLNNNGAQHIMKLYHPLKALTTIDIAKNRLVLQNAIKKKLSKRLIPKEVELW